METIQEPVLRARAGDIAREQRHKAFESWSGG